jgi:excinuclease ABC subunit A
MNNHKIILKKVKVHNLKDVDLELTPGEIIVFTGVSGSGKSSLAFDTIYIEGQRRYLESLSKGSRRYIKEMPKPEAEKIEGLAPTIAIEQKSIAKNERSTVGTITGIYDFLRVIFAKVGTPHCPVSGEKLQSQSKEKIINTILEAYNKKKVILLAPFAKNKKSSFKDDFEKLLSKGFSKVYVDNNFLDLSEVKQLDETSSHSVDIVIDRLVIDKIDKSRAIESISFALETGNGFFTILDVDEDKKEIFSTSAYSEKSKKSYPPLSPSNFSFNHPDGACPKCHGLGHVHEFDLEKIINFDLSIAQDCCSIASSYGTIRYKNIYDNLAKIYKFDINTPFSKLPRRAKNAFLNGCKSKYLKMFFTHPAKKIRWREYVKWNGVLHEAHKKLTNAKSDIYKNRLKELMSIVVCPNCLGRRIKNYPAATTIANTHIYDICSMTIEKAHLFFDKLTLSKTDAIIADDLLKEIKKKLTFLNNVGLQYLSLERTSPTLSGGEGQRVKLAGQIGCGLVGTIYVLDEPSIGLHPYDHNKLLTTLKELKHAGNTIIIVEHDKDTIQIADTIVDVGPKAGYKGGEIIKKGSLFDILNTKNSLTGQYLSGQKKIEIPKRKKLKKFIEIIGANHHNLKNINTKIPLSGLVCITGVSGSGKSSLIADILYPALSNILNKSKLKKAPFEKIENINLLDKVIFVDQSPIGRTIRSNPATYIKLLGDIRELFASLPESRIYGYKPGHFSFNVKQGSCPFCKGMGFVKVDMDFMEDQQSICQQCNGKRFDSRILSVKFKGKNIYDVLQMEVKQAKEHFSSIPSISKKLNLLIDVGLDYIHLGQSSTTLSGGEAQRIKLSKELSRPSTGKTLYILDEPTTGLHFDDIKKLIEILKKLTKNNNTVLVIEHNTDFIKTADWIVDLGPGAGEKGGQITGQGTPEDIAKLKTPTGIVLKEVLKEKPIDVKQKNYKKEKVITPDTIIQGASQNNLKNVDLKIFQNKINVFTGPSGSGKTSLAFDTIFAEAQRRYIEALPHYFRQSINLLPKPKLQSAKNLLPSIGVENSTHITNPRSTIGTLTEIYDFLRIIYANIGIAHCPETKEKIKTISKEYVADKLLNEYKNKKAYILAKSNLRADISFEDFLSQLNKNGFLRIRLNGKYYEIDEKIPFDKSVKNELFIVIDRLVINDNSKKRLLEAIDIASKQYLDVFYVDIDKKDLFFNLSFAVESTGKSYQQITANTFSFNSDQGYCLECQGIGSIISDINFEGSIPDFFDYSIDELFDLIFKRSEKKMYDLYLKYFKKINIDPYIAICDLPKNDIDAFMHGTDKKSLINNISFSWKGLNTTFAFFAKHAHRFIRWPILALIEEKTCPLCHGKRLNPLALHVTIDKKSISDVCELSIDKTATFIDSIYLSVPTNQKKILDEIFSQVKKRLLFLKEIGLGYLTLSRSAPSVSRGELQRAFLARQLGTSLATCCYILDEPTIGLHPKNNHLLMQALKKLQNQNNTIIIVEHDTQTIKCADYIYDFGPKAGNLGGEIVAHGTIDQIRKNKKSPTGRFLEGKEKISLPTTNREPTQFIKIENATLHNLKNISVSIPLNSFCCICGVSGAGKSTLIYSILKKAISKALLKRVSDIDLGFAKVSNLDKIDKAIYLMQDITSFTIRANVCSYSDILTHLRTFYSSLPLSKKMGLKPRNFSYNHKSGMCKNCYGLGKKTIELQYMPSVKIKCDVCHGYRLTKQSLEVTYKNKHLGHVLNMSLIEAKEFFSSFAKIVKKLDVLISVGLGYLKLGQDIATLSGGEMQRLKLAKELAKRSTNKTIYIFDEPSVGLNFQDIENLLKIFHKLVDNGHSLIIIEHNMDVLKNADYLIELGPDAGEKGGSVIFSGKTKNIIDSKKSITKKYLSSLLKK